VWSKAGRFMEGLDAVGGVTLVSEISIIMCLIMYLIKKNICDACNIIIYFVASGIIVNSI
jgi:hypothetical protein